MIKYSFFTTLLVLLMLTGCKEDESLGLPPTADLETLITEAEDLVANSVEGTSPGDYKPGTIQKLQAVLTWVDWQVANATKQKQIDNAATRLQKSIDEFKASTVELAIPIFNNTAGSWIQISENIKPILTDNFTIEIEAYYLGPGWIETIFSAGEGDGGAATGGPFGFNLRSFGNRLDLVIGAGADGWVETYYEGGDGLKLGEWVHYAVTKSGSEWKVYMDGVEVISRLDGPTGTIFNSDVPFVLGETPFWPGRGYNGMLSDFRVWSEVRTSDQLIANKDILLVGTEENLEVYFPLDADLGTFLTDNTGNYTATFVGDNVVWAPGGIPPEIVLDYTLIDQAIAAAQTLHDEVVEGTNDGDYPVGTKAYIQSLIDDATDVKTNAEKQDQLDSKADQLSGKLSVIETTLVADADGVYIDRDNPDAVGLRITPNYTPQGNYTVEFEVKVETLYGYGTGEFFNNGEMGIWVYGYTEYTEEAILNSGGLRNFTSGPNGWEMGPTAPPLTIRSGGWQHVAVTHDEDVGGHPITIMYVDGVETGRDSIGVPNVSGWGEIWLGNGWGKMHGSIKNFRMWNEVRTELNATIDGTEANLEIYFPLNRVAGVGFKDETGDYDGEMRGISWNTN